MAMRVKDSVEQIRSRVGMEYGGSRTKPPKAVAHRASLEASRSMPEHQKATQRLTSDTVAFSTRQVYRFFPRNRCTTSGVNQVSWEPHEIPEQQAAIQRMKELRWAGRLCKADTRGSLITFTLMR